MVSKVVEAHRDLRNHPFKTKTAKGDVVAYSVNNFSLKRPYRVRVYKGSSKKPFAVKEFDTENLRKKYIESC